jgi:hypothetical protein
MTPLIFPKINVSAALKPVYVEAQAWNQNPSQGDAGGVIVRLNPAVDRRGPIQREP